MLAELVDRLVELGQEVKDVKVVDAKDPRKLLLLVNGALVERDVPAGPRHHQVATLFDLMKAARQEFAAQPVIWHNDAGVILLLDDGDRRETVTLKLTLSPAYLALFALGKAVEAGQHPGFQPKELVNFFRRTLAGTIYDRPFVQNLRKIKWKTTEELRQNSISQGRESIGKDIEAELQTDVVLPEELTIELPVYSTPYEDEMFPVRCLVDVDAIDRRIYFLPEPGALQLALQAKQKDIREQLEAELKDTQIEIFQGTP